MKGFGSKRGSSEILRGLRPTPAIPQILLRVLEPELEPEKVPEETVPVEPPSTESNDPDEKVPKEPKNPGEPKEHLGALWVRHEPDPPPEKPHSKYKRPGESPKFRKRLDNPGSEFNDVDLE